jgi:hypothetical protein
MMSCFCGHFHAIDPNSSSRIGHRLNGLFTHPQSSVLFALGHLVFWLRMENKPADLTPHFLRAVSGIEGELPVLKLPDVHESEPG